MKGKYYKDIDPQEGLTMVRLEAQIVDDKGKEIVGLDLRDGYVRWRRHLTVAGVAVVATALTVTEPGRLLIGTTDGRLLDCSTV